MGTHSYSFGMRRDRAAAMGPGLARGSACSNSGSRRQFRTSGSLFNAVEHGERWQVRAGEIDAEKAGEGFAVEHTLDAVRRVGGDATQHLFDLGSRGGVGGVLQDDGGRSGA